MSAFNCFFAQGWISFAFALILFVAYWANGDYLPRGWLRVAQVLLVISFVSFVAGVWVMAVIA